MPGPPTPMPLPQSFLAMLIPVIDPQRNGTAMHLQVISYFSRGLPSKLIKIPWMRSTTRGSLSFCAWRRTSSSLEMVALFPFANVGRILPIIAHFSEYVELFMRTYIAQPGKRFTRKTAFVSQVRQKGRTPVRLFFLHTFVRKNESFCKPFLNASPKWIILCSTSRERAFYRLMATVKAKKGVIGILTGGGDVPGLNPAIRAVTLRALREGFQVIGIRHGWAGLVDMVREKDYDNSDNYF